MPPPRRIVLADGTVYDDPDPDAEALAAAAGLAPREIRVDDYGAPFRIEADAAPDPVVEAARARLRARGGVTLAPGVAGAPTGGAMTDAAPPPPAPAGPYDPMTDPVLTASDEREAAAAAALADVNERDRLERLRGLYPPSPSDFHAPTATDYAGTDERRRADMVADVSRAVREALMMPEPGRPAPARSAAEVAAGSPPWSGPLTPGEAPLSDEEAFAEAAAAADPETAAALHASGWRPRRTAPAAPPVPPGEAMVDLLTDRPRDAAPLFEERRETPLDRDLALNERRRALEARRAEAAGTGYAMERDAIAGAEAARAENERNRREAMGAARQRYRTAIDRANAMTLDPEGWYHDRGAVGTIGAAIAIGLGALGSSITGGDNSAISIINSSIDRDLEAQRQRIDSAYRGADAEAGLLDMLSQEFDSRDAAVAAARSAMLEDVARRVGETAAGLEGTEAGLRAAELREELIRQAAESAAAAERQAFDDELARRRAVAETISAEAEAARDARRAAGGGGGAPDGVTPAQMDTYNRAIDSGASPEEAATTAGVDPRLIPRAGRFAEASSGDSAAASARLSTAVGRVERMIAESGDDVPGVGIFDEHVSALTEGGRRMRQHLDALVNMYGRVHSGGAITADEQALFRSILFGHGTEAELRTGLEIIRGEIGASESRDREGRPLGGLLDDATSAVGGTVVSP